MSAKDQMWGAHYTMTKYRSEHFDRFSAYLITGQEEDELEETLASVVTNHLIKLGVGNCQMQQFQFTQEDLNPICNTLEQLYSCNSDVYACQSENDCILRHSSSVAFALRHCPQLQLVKQFCDFTSDETYEGNPNPKDVDDLSMNEAIQLLHSQVHPTEPMSEPQQANGTNRKKQPVVVRWTTNSPFTGAILFDLNFFQ